MKALLQRVSDASVTVEGETIGRIGRGVVLFLAVERGDGEGELVKMVRKVAGLRLFADEQGKMNRSLVDVGGAVLAISQFTLAANLKKGFRPSFDGAEEPEQANRWFAAFCQRLQAEGVPVAMGRFGANMQVQMVNDGPVTFFLEFPPDLLG